MKMRGNKEDVREEEEEEEGRRTSGFRGIGNRDREDPCAMR
jgi:hypothetical protein